MGNLKVETKADLRVHLRVARMADSAVESLDLKTVVSKALMTADWKAGRMV